MTQQSLTRTIGVLFLASITGLWGCQSSQENTAAATPDTGSEFQEAPVEPPPPMPTKLAEFQTVYFDFDRFDIRDDARPALRGNADAVNAADAGAVTIEGHCDERGSAEYNLALGERRANAVKRYLVDLGVPSSKLRTVSFGEDRPAVQGHDESAWRYNRRADFVQ
ncbi:MAG: peptidoglycan-associated lipoprotein Pal [Myxococcota bacterium]